MKTLIDECKKMLITEPEDCLGGWGLIDVDPVYVLFLNFEVDYSITTPNDGPRFF